MTFASSVGSGTPYGQRVCTSLQNHQTVRPFEDLSASPQKAPPSKLTLATLYPTVFSGDAASSNQFRVKESGRRKDEFPQNQQGIPLIPKFRATRLQPFAACFLCFCALFVQNVK
jgi:hypothetical protein